MRKTLLLIVATCVALLAQEGHPLVGSWHGTYGPDTKDRKDLTVVMMWDGKEISGLVNPGVDGGKLQNGSLDPNGWKVHFEADLKSGHFVADGHIEDITNIRRSIVGTYTQGSAKGDFRIRRDS